jgi:eukaryotic-like serine/threonine-protein kinase
MPNPLTEALAHFDRIVELDRAERAAALAELDPAVALAVAELLRADDASSGVLDRGVQVFATELVGIEDAAAASIGVLKSGDAIGTFVLQRLLGRGGMGEVWLAERKREADDSFVQEVALKVLKRGMDSDAMSARFVQERKILAELNHPHFARFIDGGVSADGRLYYAMEYVDGINLIEHASTKNLSVRERVRLLAEVAEAVAYAQNHLIVHRDLKPSNILVDATGSVRVLDFGIAKLLGERAPNDTLTHTGVHALSPAYAAPEQVLGLSISTATDVYALGVILFELITGTMPHTRNLVSYEALIAQVNSEQTPIPSQALRRLANSGTSSLHNVRALREVSGDLDTIILTALKREPARRYASAAALADDLRRWLAARPIAAQPDSRSYRIKKFVARNRLMVGSASGVLLALIAGLALALWQAGIARKQAARADAEARRASMQAIRADRVKDFVLALFQEQNPLTRDKARAATAGELIERGISTAKSELAADVETQAKIIGELAELQFGLGDIPKSVPNLQAALALHERAGGKESTEYAKVLSALGGAWYSLGETEKASEAIESALSTLRKTSGVDSIETANAETHKLRLALIAGRLDEALTLAQHAHAVYARQRGALHATTLNKLNNVGGVLSQLDRLDEAEQVYRDVISGYERSNQGDHSALIYPRVALARTLKDVRRYDESSSVFESALTAAKNSLDADHPLIGQILLHQGDLFRRQRLYLAAEKAWQEAEDIFAKKGLYAERGGLGVYRGALAMEQYRYEQAIAHYEQALLGYQKGLGPNTMFSYSAALRLAKARAAAGQTARAIKDGSAAHEALKALAQPGTFDESHAHEAWAEVLFEAKQWPESESQYREALKVHIAINGSETIDVAVVEWQIAETLYAQNRELTEALARIENSIKLFRKNDANDTSLGDALLLRGKLLARAQKGDEALSDWRAARDILLAAFGAEDPRVREITKLLNNRKPLLQ